MKLALALAIAVGLAVAPAAAQTQPATPPIIYQPDPDSPIGARNPRGAPGLAQFDFVIGDWDADITFRPPGRDPLNYRGRWHNSWIVDGFVVMQEWRGPYATGAELRHYDPQTDTWSGFNVYVGQPFRTTTARREGDTMIVLIEGNADQRGPFINRETYSDITENSFHLRSELSYDGGATWERGRYELVATRRSS
ncbi:MAG: hypothetical protein R3C16_07485 [Hyphomonadaceae bacterium]